MNDALAIATVDCWRVRIPLATPYHLSKVYGTLTHSDVVLLRVTTVGGITGWGEADPGGVMFTGDTAESVMVALRDGAAARLVGVAVDDWVANGRGRELAGTIGAACDVAIHDALARATDQPLWALLGERRREAIDVLWPTSSGDAESDLAIIRESAASGFRTFMLKTGAREIGADLERVAAVCAGLPASVRVMVDANQGWSREQAREFVAGAAELPLILVEQPLPAADLDGLAALRERATMPISVDESLQTTAQAERIIAAGAADVFSIKVSKNGGLRHALDIAALASAAGVEVLMNSMIELGITQSASLHLGCVLDNLLDCGHAYMSTLRMADDVTDFSAQVRDGRAWLPDGPGLGVHIDVDAIARYQVEEHHV